jgi:membrane protein insertase Oxa1/YidC/SpoIIIJ
MVKEVKEAGMNTIKLQEIQNKYKSDLDECEKLDDGKSDTEQRMMMEEMKKCDAYKEMESTMKDL